MSDLLLELQSLQRKEIELLTALETINVTFDELGIKVHNQLDHNPQATVISSGQKKALDYSKVGINIQGQLSERGKNKAKEYFQDLDLDADGLLQYEDLLELGAFGNKDGAIQETFYQSRDAWKLYMLNEQYPVEEYSINQESFIQFRTNIEPKQSLIKELTYLGISLLPKYLLDWSETKLFIKELLENRQFSSNVMSDQEKEIFKHALTFDEIQFLLNLKGLNYTKPEIGLLMYWRCLKANIHEQLIRVYSKRNISQQEFSFRLDAQQQLKIQWKEEENIITNEQINIIPIDSIIAWIQSGPQFLDFNAFYRKIMWFKYSYIRTIRLIDETSRFLFTLAGHINDRLILRDFLPLNKLSKQLQDISTYKCSFSIGNDTNLNGLACSWKFMKIENIENILKQINAPNGSGTVFTINWLFNQNITQEQMNHTAELTRSFCLHHIEREMKKNPSFNGIHIHVMKHDLDDAFIMRMNFSYKKLVSIDRFLEHILLQYRFLELFPVLVGDFRTNITLSEIITNKVNCFDESFACMASITTNARRNLIVEILDRLIYAFQAAITNDQADFLTKLNTQTNENTTTTSNSNNTQSSPLFSDDDYLRGIRWKTIFPYYDTISTYFQSITNFFRGLKTGTFKYGFRSIGDCINKLSVLFGLQSRHWFSEEFLYKSGYIRDWYLSFIEQSKQEYMSHYNTIKAYLEAKKREEQEKRYQELMNVHGDSSSKGSSYPKSDSKAKNKQKNLLKSIGLEEQGMDEYENPLEFIKTLENDLKTYDLLNLRLLEAIRKNIISVHTIEIISGKTKFTLLPQNMDFIELLPEFPSMEHVYKANLFKSHK